MYIIRVFRLYRNFVLLITPPKDWRVDTDYNRYFVALVWFFKRIPILEQRRPISLIIRGRLNEIESLVSGHETSLWS